MTRTIKILIGSSLLLNVLLIGVVIGNLSSRLFREDFPRRRLPEFTVKLPPEKEKLFLEMMEKVHLKNREFLNQIDETRERVLSILSAPEFDEAAYQAATTEVEELRGVMMQRFSGATKDLAKQLNPEERKALAEYLRQPPPQPLPYQAGRPPQGGPPPVPEVPPSRRMP
jgi:uncharacterized membrane protein